MGAVVRSAGGPARLDQPGHRVDRGRGLAGDRDAAVGAHEPTAQAAVPAQAVPLHVDRAAPRDTQRDGRPRRDRRDAGVGLDHPRSPVVPGARAGPGVLGKDRVVPLPGRDRGGRGRQAGRRPGGRRGRRAGRRGGWRRAGGGRRRRHGSSVRRAGLPAGRQDDRETGQAGPGEEPAPGHDGRPRTAGRRGLGLVHVGWSLGSRPDPGRCRRHPRDGPLRAGDRDGRNRNGPALAGPFPAF